jgi:translation initiation factor IF-2
MQKPKPIAEARPPIVAIVGHIDHGKSTLLDYIRKSNVVEGEAGGITQHLSAYEALHRNASGEHLITFLDTPGHEAFRAMRSRGLEAADVAVVVVSAEEGVKLQTIEALKLIEEVKIPFIVAFSKIDKPGANLERAKMSLLENNVFLEGMGGSVPFIPISSKSGEGIPELLDLILLAAELEGLSNDPLAAGEGLVIEAHVDGKRGNTATLIIKNGSVKSGEFVVAGAAVAPVRIMENFLGKPIKEASSGSPIRIVGFSSLPQVGATWHATESKKEAEQDATEIRNDQNRGRTAVHATKTDEVVTRLIVPILIKTDFAGTGEAVVHELEKLPKAENMEARVVNRGVGTITEGDVRLVGGGQTPGIIAGFNVKVEREARELAERQSVTIGTFDIIYKLAEWLGEELETRRPRQRSEEKTGLAKILKIFSTEKGRVVLGGKVEEGELREGAEVRVMRRDLELGRGEILSLQSQKKATKKVEAGSEFGMMLKAPLEPAAGDHIEAFEVVLK